MIYATLRHGNKILFVSPVFRGNLVILWDAECLKEYLKDKVSHQGRCHAVCTVLAFRKKEKQFWCHYVKHQGGGGGGAPFVHDLMKSDRVGNTQQVVITNWCGLLYNPHGFFCMEIFLTSGRPDGLMVSALVSESSGPGSSPSWGHIVVFLGKTLDSHSAPFHPGA